MPHAQALAWETVLTRRRKFIEPGMRVRLAAQADRVTRLLGPATPLDTPGEVLSPGLVEGSWRVAFPRGGRRRIVALRPDQIFRIAAKRSSAPQPGRAAQPPSLVPPPGGLCRLLV